MEISNRIQEFVMAEDREFDSSHASTLLELKGGDVLAAWFGGSWEKGADVAIWAARRVRGIWEKPRKLADERGIAMWNPVLFRKADGSIVLYYKVGKTIPVWQTWYLLSVDEGETFQAPAELVPGDIGGRGPVKNKPIRLSDGTILAPASLEGDTWDCFVDISSDDGETWGKSDSIQVRRSGYEIQMVDRPYSKYHCYGKGIIQPTLWEDPAGVVHALFRSTSSRVFKSESYDQGRTWSLAYATELPNNNSGLDVVRLPKGTLVLAYNPTQNLPNYYKGPRTPLVLSCSEDNGATWKELAVLEDGPGGYAYPAIICSEDKLMVTYTWKRERVVFSSFDYKETI